ncbi:hypothetical protein FDECE_17491, partial [Fusarium decemcellulare]
MSSSSDRNSPETPDSSGAQTPSLGSNPNRASASYISNMWTGLIRRFSSEGSHFHSQADTAYEEDHAANGVKDGINGVYTPIRRTASPLR